MSLPCDTSGRLAGPVGTTPIQWAFTPGDPPPQTDLQRVAFSEPDEMPIPGYLATARRHALAVGDSPTALARLAQAELSAGELDAALSTASEILELGERPRDRAAQFAAVQVLRAARATDAARESLRAAGAGDGFTRTVRARVAIEAGDLEDAAELVKDASTFDGLFIAGWLQMRHGEHAQAIALFRRAGRLAGATPDVLVNTGYSYAALGHLDHAIKVTEEAQALAPHRKMIAFNLVNFHLALGAYSDASKALEPLRRHCPEDVEIALAIAHIELRAGDREGAHKTLQRARTSSSWASAPLIRRAELVSDLAVLRWINGKRTLSATRKIVIEQLEDSDYQSLPIASLLVTLLPSFHDAPELDRLIGRLQPHHEPDKLLFLRVHQAILRRDADAAVTLAVQWANKRPFNPVAAAVAIQLLGSAAGRPQEAIELGRSALKRAPGDALLVNNLAFRLALSGELSEARAVLRKLRTREDAPAVLATKGLVELLAGNVGAGIDGYRRAEARALKQGNERLAQLAGLNLQFALRRADPAALAKHHVQLEAAVSIPPSMGDDPAAWLLGLRAEHEQIPIIWAEDEPADTHR
jgi:tetratricopeptide (TPR) repeat protein